MPVIRKFKVKRRKGAVARPACKKRLNCRTVRLPGQKSDQVVVACRTAGELKEYGERLRRRARCAAKKEAAARKEAAAKKRKGRKSPSTASTARPAATPRKSAPREEAAPKKKRKSRKSPTTASTTRQTSTSEGRSSASESFPRAATPRKTRAASSTRRSKSRASKSEPRRLEASRTSSAHGLGAGDSRSPFLLGAGQERKLPSNLRAALDRMGLDWPTTQKKVGARFSELALKKHPDRGGSNQQMKVLVQDRKIILSAIAVNSDD